MVVRGLHLPGQMATFHCILQKMRCHKFKLCFEFFYEGILPVTLTSFVISHFSICS
uniref:Uncharacterized protein n=1 Tax=Arundo donax TaxID=35708 RepID=A0A0A9F7T3_ARUDO